ncbi:MAG: aryl-sulfate sulfotransferase [Chloroflexi bacterium]|nr:aryl-sulfate sulfotransferase [Chloroflexota bacterium]
MIRRYPIILALAIVLLVIFATSSVGGSEEHTVGLIQHDAGALEGYTLLGPLRSGTTYLIDNDGMVVHSWQSAYEPGAATYLLENGHLLRTASIDDETFTAGGSGGRIEEFNWDGNLVWEYEYATDRYFAHHDIAVLPNGNILILAWDLKTRGEAIAAGRDSRLLEDDELWAEQVVEIRPTGASGGEIVWQWSLWDHVVQDNDYFDANFGSVADNPQLIDLNYFNPSRPEGGEADWVHANALDYNAELDQIMISARHFDELWIIDHSTTTEEAASHSGGASGMGGDILYRWGNPQAYDAGSADDQMLFLQHDAQWIRSGLPGEGNILIFNNGNGRTPENYSSVDELVPPVDGDGNYSLTPGEAFGPDALTWTYEASTPTDFYSSFVSGAQRLSNGSTLIGAGALGTIFEVMPDGQQVWRYVNPVTADGPLAQGDEIPNRSNIFFRAMRFEPSYPAFEGKTLTPQGVIELEKGAVPPTPSATVDAPTVTPTSTLVPPTSTPVPPTPTATPVPVLLGDVNDDGMVNSVDSLLILQHVAELLDDLANADAADVNGDGVINAVDAALILQFVAGLLANLP